jgi:hypothetical protein
MWEDEVCDKMKPPHKASAFEAQLKRVNLSINKAARGHTTRIDIAPYRRHVHHPAQSRSDEKRQARGGDTGEKERPKQLDTK